MKQYLLDTHTLLWMQDDSKLLSTRIKKILSDSSSILNMSIATFWEITIKLALGKLVLDYTIDDLSEACIINNINILPIQISTLNQLRLLPHIHKDPFDRIIASTAIDLGLTIITLDENIKKYGLTTVW